MWTNFQGQFNSAVSKQQKEKALKQSGFKFQLSFWEVEKFKKSNTVPKF